MVHLGTIPITGTGINPARSFGAAVIYNNDKAWDDQVSSFFFCIPCEDDFFFLQIFTTAATINVASIQQAAGVSF